MGAEDIVTKDYTKESHVVADAFNQYIYKGEHIIKPENLKPLDTNITGIPYGAEGAGVPVQRYRDVLKSVTAMEDHNAVYIDQFQTNLREVMLFIKYSKDRAKLNDMLQKRK